MDVYPTFASVKEFSAEVRSLFKTSTLDTAIHIASDEQMESFDLGRVQVFIPTTERVTPSIFHELLVDPQSYLLRLGDDPCAIFPIYGTKRDAFLGSVKMAQRPHPGFFVYDASSGIIVDFINRDGKSMMNPALRSEFIGMLEREMGYDISWREQALVE